MPKKANTYGLTQQDFIDCRLSTLTTLHYVCPHCGAKVSEWCRQPNGRIYNGIHIARTQAYYNKCKRVKDFVAGKNAE